MESMEMNDLIKYIYSSQKSLNEIIKGLKFSLSTNVNEEILDNQGISYDVDENNVHNIVINPVEYPNNKEAFKILNIKEYIDNTVNNDSSNKFVIRNYFTGDFQNDRQKMSGYILNPFEDRSDKIAIRGRNIIFNYKKSDESNDLFSFVFSGNNNNSTFFNFDFSNTITRFQGYKNTMNYEYDVSFNKKLNFNNINQSKQNSYVPYRRNVPTTEIDGAVLSVPFGISFYSPNPDYFGMYKSNESLITESRDDIEYRWNTSADYFNMMSFVEEGIEFNNKTYFVFRENDGTLRDNVKLSNFDIDNLNIDGSEIEESLLTRNYFNILYWDEDDTMHLGSEVNNPNLTFKNNGFISRFDVNGLRMDDNGDRVFEITSNGSYMKNVDIDGGIIDVEKISCNYFGVQDNLDNDLFTVDEYNIYFGDDVKFRNNILLWDKQLEEYVSLKESVLQDSVEKYIANSDKEEVSGDSLLSSGVVIKNIRFGDKSTLELDDNRAVINQNIRSENWGFTQNYGNSPVTIFEGTDRSFSDDWKQSKLIIYKNNVNFSVEDSHSFNITKSYNDINDYVFRVEWDSTNSNSAIYMDDLPTSDPGEAGRIWNNAGSLAISSG